MDLMIATGKPLKVTVNPGSPGMWPKEHVQREVHAIGYQGGDTHVLVADEAGRFQWLSPDKYSVAQGSR